MSRPRRRRPRLSPFSLLASIGETVSLLFAPPERERAPLLFVTEQIVAVDLASPVYEQRNANKSSRRKRARRGKAEFGEERKKKSERES